jgi:hypothetical protein
MEKAFKINDKDLIIEALAVLIGDYEKARKKAAYLILKICLTDEFFKFLMEDDELKPIIKALR